MKIKEKIIVPYALQRKIEDYWGYTRVYYFCAFSGYGKTTVAKNIFKKHRACYRSAEDGSDMLIDIPTSAKVLIIDDAHLISDKKVEKDLCEMIKQRHDMRFVILSCGKLPHWLMRFQLAGILKEFCDEDFKFSYAEIKKLFNEYEINLDETEINEILTYCLGYPLAINMFAQYLVSGHEYQRSLFNIIKNECMWYIDESVFRSFKRTVRELLLVTTPFDEFDVNFAKILTGKENVKETIEKLSDETTFLIYKNEDTYKIKKLFKDFLNWKFNYEYLESEKKSLYSRAGIYYELNLDYMRALDCYFKADEHRKITQILTKNAELDPSIGNYYVMEKYYNRLDKEQILKSPTLMCGMSMLTSMRINYELSDYWYKELEKYGENLKKSDGEYQEVKEKLMYLDIALPQKSVDNLLKLLKQVLTVMVNKEIKFPSVSTTSRLPSILNGGKDLSDWSLKDDLLFSTLRVPSQMLLSADGVGLAETLICESKFEKAVDYSAELIRMMSMLALIQQKGTLNTEFALIGLVAKIQISQGNLDTAKMDLLSFKEKLISQKAKVYVPNVDAMICHIALLEGDLLYAREWLAKSAPKDNHNIWTMWRYQYLVKCEVLISQKDYISALIILGQLLNYVKTCDRKIDEIHVNILISICYFNMDDARWENSFKTALNIAWRYKFINTISQYGIAVLPMLEQIIWHDDKRFFCSLLKNCENHAKFYKNFLSIKQEVTIVLSKTEIAVLELICQDKSNQEICEILQIKLPTVKTHVSNILRRLNVKKRSEAKTEAKRQNLIDEHFFD